MSGHDLDDYFADFISESDKAILVDFGNDMEVWVPKSEIVYKINDKNGTVKITMPEWLAKEKGAI